MTKRVPVDPDSEKRRLVRAVIRDPCAARFRAGEKKAPGQVELSRPRRVSAQDLLESVEVASHSGAMWLVPRVIFSPSQRLHNLWGGLLLLPREGDEQWQKRPDYK